jgi:hypothetical protein
MLSNSVAVLDLAGFNVNLARVISFACTATDFFSVSEMLRFPLATNLNPFNLV